MAPRRIVSFEAFTHYEIKALAQAPYSVACLCHFSGLLCPHSTGEIIEDDDDGVFNLGSRNSGISIALDPGDYIVEATTYAGSATGDFTLTILRPELAALRALYNATDGPNWTSRN